MTDVNWKDRCWVATIFLVRDHRVLLTWNKNFQAWIPVGGHIEPGESPKEAVSREVQEEVGCNFEFLRKSEYESNGNVEILKPSRVQIEKVPHHGHHINFVFFGICLDQTTKQETDEQEKLKWFSTEELLRIKDGMIESVWKLSLEAIEAASLTE